MTTEQQRYLAQVEIAAEQARIAALVARRRASIAAKRAGTERARFNVECYEHAANVAEERAAFDTRTAAMLRQAYGLGA